MLPLRVVQYCQVDSSRKRDSMNRLIRQMENVIDDPTGGVVNRKTASH